MIARGFKSVIWVATVGGAALSCYMVSLRVATERADLAKVEGQIIAAKRDIRSLQTELGTRGRLSQLEQWNSDVLALAAPTSDQFVRDEVTLARLEQPGRTVAAQSANVRMASAEAPEATPPSAVKAEAPPRVLPAIAPPPPPAPLVRQASYSAPAVPAENRKAAVPAAKPAKPSLDSKSSREEGAAAKPETPVKAKATVLAQASDKSARPAAVKAEPSKSAVARAAPPGNPKPASARPAPARGSKASGGDGNR
jgi:hypothetical protein